MSIQGGAKLLGILSRFGVAGLINTMVGLAVIFVLDLGFGVHPQLANTVGYGVGISLSFVLSRSYVFRSREQGSGARYLAAVGIAFAVNQAVLTAAGALLGEASWARGAAQLCGMVAYTLTQFGLSYFWVFRERSRAAQRGG